MTKSNLLLGIVISALVAGGWLITAPAQVFDEAKFFSRDVALQADEQLRQLGRTYGLTLVMETFMQPPADVAELIRDTDKQAAAFAHWAQQCRATRHASLYILICRKPAHVEIALHESLARRFPKDKLDALRDTLVQNLRARQPDNALRESVALIERVLSGDSNRDEKNKPVAGVPAAGQPDAASVPDDGQGGSNVTLPNWAILMLLFLFMVIILVAIMRGPVSANRGPTPYGPPVAGGPPPGGGGGYGGHGGYGGSGSFLRSLVAGLFGGAVGSWIYDRFFRGGTPAHAHDLPTAPGSPGPAPLSPDDPTARYAPESGQATTTGGDFDDADVPATTGTGADFDDTGEQDAGGDWDTGGADNAGFNTDTGGDFGGDFGGGDFSGGDFGGGDFGGGGEF